jgi:hypothetical protein
MPTSSPPNPGPRRLPWRTFASLASLAFSFALAVVLPPPARPQTLAQKNWAGSGVSTEPWWRRAVFYRIDPDRFQDSTGSGSGDLAGIAQRLDYIQSLGVDAILLAPAPGAPPITPNLPGVDDLTRGAVDHHLRLLIELPAPESQAAASDTKLLNLARAWFNQGAAGLYIPTRAFAQVDGAEHIGALLRQLHALTAALPGDRILLAEAPPAHPDSALVHALAQNIQLTAAEPITLTQPSAANLRAQLAATLADPAPLLVAARVPAQPTPRQQDALDRTVAAMLLASRAAVLLDYGAEAGLIPAPDTPLLMQWTPSNRTPGAAPPPSTATASTASGPPPDNGFHPFVPPLPRNFFSPPRMPEIVAVDHPVNPLREPNSLPGFTTAPLPPGTALNAATANIALEDTVPTSLLGFYRRLIQMHHDNASLHNGVETLLDHDADGALVWTRQAPPNSITAASDFIVCNLSEKPLTLSLDALHLHTASFRTLFGAAPTRSGQSMTIAPWVVFVGEAAR